MAKLKSEDLRLNIIVNGDAGRKEILDTQKSISSLESQLKSLTLRDSVALRAPASLPACGGALQSQKENQRSSKLGADSLSDFAESEGFEPPEAFTSTVFKTAALNHSANSPESLQTFLLLKTGLKVLP